MSLLKRIAAPPDLNTGERRNYIGVQLDAIGVGIASAAAPYLPVFLARLGATSTEVGLLTTMPALTGLILAIPMGRFLQRQKNIVRWYSMMRLSAILGYALTGLIAFLLAEQALVWGVLGIWALITIPQTILAITFNVVMNAVAGKHSRYELMTRRWSILGLTTTLMGLITGQLLTLNNDAFPLNFQIAFILLSLGGVFSAIITNRIKIDLPEPEVTSNLTEGDEVAPRLGIQESIKAYFKPILANRPFLSFMSKRLVFLFGSTLAVPLFPIFYVKQVQATDGWIGIINSALTFSLVLGYFFWTRISRRHSSRYIIILTTLGVGLYPLFVSQTMQPWVLAILAGLVGFFQGGLDLVFFDELMKLAPPAYIPTFISFAQSLQYLSTMISPLLGTAIADQFGLTAGFLVSSGMRLLGCFLFGLPLLAEWVKQIKRPVITG